MIDFRTLLKNFLGKEELKEIIKTQGAKAAKDFERRTLTAMFQKAAVKVEEQFLKDGWTLVSPPKTDAGKKATAARPEKYRAAISDLLFRLWDKGVFEPKLGDKGSGSLADPMRDRHEKLIYDSIGNQLKDDTSIQDVISLIITREVDIVF